MCEPVDFQLWTPFNLLLLNLIVLEFVSASIGLPLNLASSVNQGWLFGDFMCTFTATSMELAGQGKNIRIVRGVLKPCTFQNE